MGEPTLFSLPVVIECIAYVEHTSFFHCLQPLEEFFWIYRSAAIPIWQAEQRVDTEWAAYGSEQIERVAFATGLEFTKLALNGFNPLFANYGNLACVHDGIGLIAFREQILEDLKKTLDVLRALFLIC